MFNFVARHKRLLQIILALTLVPFAFFGLDSYTRLMRGAGDVAVADGVPISAREFADELRRNQERMREVLGQQVDPAELDTPDLRAAVLESMIAQRLVIAQTVKERLSLSRDQVVAGLLSAPEFQVDGRFSPERYGQYLRSRQLSDEGNVERLRVEIPAARIAGSVSTTAFVPRTVAARIGALLAERREISQAAIAVEPLLARVKPSDADVKAFYEANLGDYRIPERVRAEYLVLSAEELGAQEAASEDELKKAYQDKLAQYTQPEQRRASHILVKTREEADKIAAQARQAPQRFAELAKKFSIDTDSAAQGGDLGMNPQGSFAAKPLDEAIFRMKPGETDVVQSEFGFHVVRLALIQAAKTRPFEEARKELAADIAKQKAAKRFAETADAFNNTVYEQSDSLKPAADKYKLKIRTTGWITRQPTPDMGPLAHPKLLSALFSADAIKEKRNTDAVEVQPGMLVAARVAEHQAAAQRPFEEVKAEVARRLSLKEAAALAQKEGAARLADLQKGGGDAGLQWSAPRMVSRREATGLVSAAMQKIMSANAAKLPAYIGIERGDQGYTIYRVSKVVPGESPKLSAPEIGRLDAQAGAEQLEAYVESLRARGKVEVNRAVLEKKS